MFRTLLWPVYIMYMFHLKIHSTAERFKTDLFKKKTPPAITTLSVLVFFNSLGKFMQNRNKISRRWFLSVTKIILSKKNVETNLNLHGHIYLSSGYNCSGFQNKYFLYIIPYFTYQTKTLFHFMQSRNRSMTYLSLNSTS